MDDGYNYDLAAAGLREGDIVLFSPVLRRRVIRHPLTGDLVLQGPGEDGQFLDLTLEEGAAFQQGYFWGGSLPTSFKGSIRVVGFQPVLRTPGQDAALREHEDHSTLRRLCLRWPVSAEGSAARLNKAGGLRDR